MMGDVIDLRMRRGDLGDLGLVLAMFDEAVPWLVARGQEEQWGGEPWSERPEARERVRAMILGADLWIAEHDGEAVGALVVGGRPGYVEEPDAPEEGELYIQLLISSRRHAGNRIGARLVELAERLAAGERLRVLRVDCWAGSPALVGWYRRQGFAPTSTFEVDGWRGQVLAKPVGARV